MSHVPSPRSTITGPRHRTWTKATVGARGNHLESISITYWEPKVNRKDVWVRLSSAVFCDSRPVIQHITRWLSGRIPIAATSLYHCSQRQCSLIKGQLLEHNNFITHDQKAGHLAPRYLFGLFVLTITSHTISDRNLGYLNRVSGA